MFLLYNIRSKLYHSKVLLLKNWNFNKTNEIPLNLEYTSTYKQTTFGGGGGGREIFVYMDGLKKD